MKRGSLTLVKPVSASAEKLEQVRAQLRLLGDRVQDGGDRRFCKIDGLHFLACCILEARNGLPPRFLIELSFDGDAASFLQRTVTENRELLDEVLGACTDYPRAASDEEVIRYLKAGLSENVFFRGTPGRSLDQIRAEEGLCAALAEALDQTSALALPRSKRWQCAVEAVKRARPHLGPAPKRPLLVRLNPTNPRFRACVYGGLRLLAVALFWLAGVAAAVGWARQPWHWIAVLGAPALLGLVSAALLVRESPRGLAEDARLSVIWLALREAGSTMFWLAPLGGLVVAAIELPLDRADVATAICWALSFMFAMGIVLVIAALLFTLWGSWAAGGGVVGAAALLAWRFQASPSHGLLLLEMSMVALALVGIVVALLGVYAVALRRLEIERRVWDEDDDLAHLERVARREYSQLQSHLASETIIDEGRLRMRTLRAALRWVNLSAAILFNRGHLGGIESIHFARFVVLPDRRGLVFLSNYDGRFDDYLGEFAEGAGLTAIWGNAVGFPRPYLLFFDGARRADLFKRYARASQVESLLWYSAYPNLPVSEINRATELHEYMDRPLATGERGFIADLKRWWHPPIDEPTLDVLMDGR